MHTWSDEDTEGIFENRSIDIFHGGPLKITLTVHIIVIVKKKFKRPTPEAKRFRLGPGARSIVMTSDQ